MSAFEGHELHKVATERTLVFEHTYTWWGNKRVLRVLSQPNVTLTWDHVPNHCKKARTIILGPLMPEDIDCASFTNRPQGTPFHNLALSFLFPSSKFVYLFLYSLSSLTRYLKECRGSPEANFCWTCHKLSHIVLSRIKKHTVLQRRGYISQIQTKAVFLAELFTIALSLFRMTNLALWWL